MTTDQRVPLAVPHLATCVGVVSVPEACRTISDDAWC